MIPEPANKAATMIQSSLITRITSNYRNGFTSLHAFEETVSQYRDAILFPLYSPFIERFNEKIHYLRLGGLIDHWESDFLNPKGILRKPEDIGPQVLTMDHLEVCFLITLFSLLLGLIAFAGEVGYAWWKKFQKQRILEKRRLANTKRKGQKRRIRQVKKS